MTIINNTSKGQDIEVKRYEEILSKYLPTGISVTNSSSVSLSNYKIPAKKADIIVFGR
jgi:hypothetical protein